MTSVLGYARTFIIGGSYTAEPLPDMQSEIARFHAMLEDLGTRLARRDFLRRDAGVDPAGTVLRRHDACRSAGHAAPPGRIAVPAGELREGGHPRGQPRSGPSLARQVSASAMGNGIRAAASWAKTENAASPRCRCSVVGCRCRGRRTRNALRQPSTDNRQRAKRRPATTGQRGEAAEAHCCLKMPPERTARSTWREPDDLDAIAVADDRRSCPSPATCCGGGITARLVVSSPACSCSQATPARRAAGATSIGSGAL